MHIQYIREIRPFFVKIINVISGRLANRARILWVRLSNSNLTMNGEMHFDKGTRVKISPSGNMTLVGPFWANRFVTLQVDAGSLMIGPGTSLGAFNVIGVMRKVTIGANCLFAEGVSIRDHDHAFQNRQIPVREQGWVVAPVIIGNNVWIGAKVTILRGCTIGDNAIIGANSVVTRDIPPNVIAVGAPARPIRNI